MNIHGVIRFPHITEKSTLRSEEAGSQLVTLQVRTKANKHQIKKAVEEVFEVKVDKVRTATFQGKIKRQGRYQGRRPAWKKAYVTLKPGERIEFFEGV